MRTDFSGTQYKMTAQKEQKKPSFPLILSVLSIVFYCAGFLRVELDLNEQKKRIQALESIEEAKSYTNILDLVTKSKEINPGKFLTKLLKKKKDSTFQNNLHSHHLPNKHDSLDFYCTDCCPLNKP